MKNEELLVGQVARFFELAEECEKADGPDRILDWKIRGLLVPRLAGEPLGRKTVTHERAYTGLFEEAWRLIPDDWRFGMEQAGKYDRDPRIEAWCWPADSNFDPDWRNGDEGYRSNPAGVRTAAKTEVLALCAAALRARAMPDSKSSTPA